MDEQRIEKQNRSVTFHLSDGAKIEGTVYLRLYQSHHTGAQKVGELLNDEQRFIPVKMSDKALLLNKKHIVAASVAAAEEADDLMRLGKQYNLTFVTTLGLRFPGEIFVNMPEASSRVKDYLNQGTPFLTLIQSESILYINQRFVLSVEG